MNKLTKDKILNTILKSDICLNEISKLLKVSKKDIEDAVSGKNKDSFSIDNNLDQKLETKIFIDGGSRGNPGESGIGIVIENIKAKKGYYFYTGIGTNNEAEYKALIKALGIAKEHNFNEVNVFSDSELICNQINGIYKVKSETLLQLNLEVKKMIADFKNFNISHVLREYNKDADKMANLAMDTKKNGMVELTAAG
jgi:ribonuclease HI